MGKNWRKTLDFLLFSNMLIALCAVAQGFVTYELLHVRPNAFILAVLFCATWALYNFSILLTRPKNPSDSPLQRIRWIFLHDRLLITVTLAASLALIILCLFLSWSSLFLLLFLALISLAYASPLFRFRNKPFGLRGVPGIKLFLIAFVWSLSCVLLPILELENMQMDILFTETTLLLFVNEFLFIVALTIPFDIRDMHLDKQYALHTLPTMLGKQIAMFICGGCILAYVIIVLLNPSIYTKINTLGILCSLALTTWVILKCNSSKNEHDHFLFIDGMLVMQLFMLLVVKRTLS